MNNEKEVKKPMRILHLEDSPMDAEIIRERLIDAGFTIEMDWACNEQEFTSYLKGFGYDLILADYLLPGFDAPAALLLAKSLCPGVPFIAVTGAVGEEKAVELLKLGATDYVLKDRLLKLPMAIERALDEAREHNARRLAEEALRESEARCRRIVDTANEGIWMFGEDLLTTFVNAKMAEMIGYRVEEMIGRPLTEFIFEEDAPDHHRRMANRHHGVSEHYELRFRHQNAETVWAQASAVPILDAGGNFQGTFGMFTDITERKQAEEKIRASLAEKEVLLKEVYHRVKNNLQIISTLLDLQFENIHDEQALTALRVSQDRIKSMALVHEKLYQTADLSSIGFAGYIESLISHLSSSFIADPEQVSVRIEIGDVKLSLEKAIPCGLIINELVSNSFKHAFPGGRKGTVTIRLQEDDHGTLTLVVADDGVGLPPGIDFRNTESMGMQLVNLLTTQLQGEISLSDEKGTAFTISFEG